MREELEIKLLDNLLSMKKLMSCVYEDIKYMDENNTLTQDQLHCLINKVKEEIEIYYIKK